MRTTKREPAERANSHASRAVRRFPRCRSAVGLGAKRPSAIDEHRRAPHPAYDAVVAGTRWLDDEEMATWRTLLRHSLLMLDHLDSELRQAHDVGLADYEILVQLSAAPRHRLRMSELADQALVSRSRLTHRVDRLVDAGLVGRERCPTDRRGVEAVLTPAGLARLEEAAPTHVAGVRRYIIDPLDRTTQAALVDQLGPVVADLELGELNGACDSDD